MTGKIYGTEIITGWAGVGPDGALLLRILREKDGVAVYKSRASALHYTGCATAVKIRVTLEILP